MQRLIIHVDMDAFFAAIEQRDNPAYRNKPVVVGGLGARGVVATASYEARRYGYRSAMSMTEARRRCPEAIFLPSNHRRYSQVSSQIRAVMAEFSPLVEPLSLDEAFLDVTGMERIYPDPMEMLQQIKSRILAEVNLTASAGAAPNKFLAKIASDIKKPNGMVVVWPHEVQEFLSPLPVNRLWGVGEVTAKVLIAQGIKTIGQLAATDIRRLEQWVGNAAYELQQLACGKDERPVVPEQAPKSVGNEETYEQDLFSLDEVRTRLLGLSVHVAWRLRLLGLAGRTITVKLRWSSFKTITRSRTLLEPTNLDNMIFAVALDLAQSAIANEGIRLIGITVSGLSCGLAQCSLFDSDNQKQIAVTDAIDKLREKFGEDIVLRGRLLEK